MAKGFTLEINPWVYLGKCAGDGTWTETYLEKEHLTPAAEAKLPEAEHAALLAKRNSFPELPLVNYTTQYGLGCFEGLKAFPQKSGGLKIFRPDGNARRMANSMKGLKMPPFPPEMFVQAVREVVKRNLKLGFAPSYDPAWEKEDFVAGHSVYIRPFTHAEGGIGVNLCASPWVVIVTSDVGSYFRPGNTKAITTTRIRATQGGTGWIKAASNYVISALAKKEAEAQGYMECMFLDACEHRYFEEGSSCNLFFLLKSGTLVTPSLEDTILPGITRASIIELAGDLGVKVEERRIAVEEVLSEAREVFASGTAAGVGPIESLTHEGREVVFNNRQVGELSQKLLKTLKGIQYGLLEDRRGWMTAV
ncbi:MAG: branched-chain-amino-acid transaminase [Spirochaetes bacterium GWB1_66_5]|nr:MAG: branched-chain-amino-acid transaminase [Spirochaetes bacterium GWB1_66_5]